MLTLKLSASSLTSNADIPSKPVYSVRKTAELMRMIGCSQKDNNLKDNNLKPRDPNILYQPFVDRNNIIFPPLHIHLGLIKQLVVNLKGL